MRRHELADEQWTAIEPQLPGKKDEPGRTAKDNRLSRISAARKLINFVQLLFTSPCLAWRTLVCELAIVASHCLSDTYKMCDYDVFQTS
jgi:hypothetical protein